MGSKFKKSTGFEERFIKANKLLKKYPDYVPVICEKTEDKYNPDIDINKYLVPVSITLGQFLMIVRQRIAIKPEEAVFLFVNNCIVHSNEQIGNIYYQHKDPDNFLYISYSKENTFGGLAII
jgi:GABA(A) receptor-associated protein